MFKTHELFHDARWRYERDTFHTSTFITIYTYTGKAVMHVCTGKARKSNMTDDEQECTCTYRVYLIDTAPQHALKSKRKDPLIDKGADRVCGPL